MLLRNLYQRQLAFAAKRRCVSCELTAQRREALGIEVERLKVAAADTSVENQGKTRIVVVGGGRMGEIRCQNVVKSDSAQLAAFVDTDPLSAARLASRFGCEAYVSLDDALTATKVDAVWVCAPTPYHSALIEKAAKVKAHVAVEKPVAMTASDIRSAYETCQAHGVHLDCAFQRRTDTAYAAVAQAVKDGKIGSLRSIRATFRDHPAPPVAFLAAGGGDPFHDLATHDIDYILSLVKDTLPPSSNPYSHHPDQVWAFGTSSNDLLRSSGVMDAATVVLTWKRGDVIELCATLDISRGSSYGYDQRIEMFGTSGASVSVQNAPASPVLTCDDVGVHSTKHVHSFPQRFEDAFENDLDHFIQCIAGKSSPKVSAHDAELATIVAEAALQSANNNTVVNLVTNQAENDVHLEYPTNSAPV